MSLNPEKMAQEALKVERQAVSVAGQASAVAHRPLTDEQKRDLVTNWFVADWAIENALGLLGDYEALVYKPPVQNTSTSSPLTEQDKVDAENYRWLLTQFRAMSLDMGGNHCWVLARSGSLRGPTIDDAIRAARAKKEPQ